MTPQIVSCHCGNLTFSLPEGASAGSVSCAKCFNRPTPAEVPEGRVLVDADDLRTMVDWIDFVTDERGWDTAGETEIRGAWARSVAALPVPEWEPSDELVERLHPVMYAGDHNTADNVRRYVLVQHAKRLHDAGLLRDDL